MQFLLTTILLAYSTLVALAGPPRLLMDHHDLNYPCLLIQVGDDDKNNPAPDCFCALDSRDTNGIEGMIFPVEGLDSTNHDIVFGDTTFYMEGAFVQDNKAIVLPLPDGVTEIQPLLLTDETFGFSTTPLGAKKVLMIRVVAKDAKPTSSVTELSDEAFGTSGDKFNMVTQFDDCSYGKFTVAPFDGDINGVQIADGVYETTLDMNVVGVDRFEIERVVTAQLATELGATWRTDAAIDFVMYCLPTTDFTAYAYFNFFLSVYSDGWCTTPTGHMHELGHNLNLHHSNENGAEYNDQSCLMGFSYLEDDSPVMCFNGPKSWFLGWYSDRHTNIDGRSNWAGEFVGIDDYNNSAGKTVILRIDAEFGPDFFVMFNRADGINAGVQEGADKVLVTSQFTTGAVFSELLALLGKGDSYTITNYDGTGDNVVIKVTELDLLSEPAVAKVDVSVSRPECLTTYLWNADDDKEVVKLPVEVPFCKQQWEFAVEARLDCRKSGDIRSIVFETTGPNKYFQRKTEYDAPWFSFGNNGGIKGIDMKVGIYVTNITVNYKDKGIPPFVGKTTFQVVDGPECECKVPLYPVKV